MNECVYALSSELLPPPQVEVLPLTDKLYHLLLAQGRYGMRQALEQDETQRQIIPYAVVTRADTVLMVERLSRGSEARLHHKLSIGIGGHIDKENHANARDLLEGAMVRELREELHIRGFISKALGLIHHDDSPVSRVHTGVLYHVRVPDTDQTVKVRENDKLRGAFTTWRAVQSQKERLETWSWAALEFFKAEGLAKGL